MIAQPYHGMGRFYVVWSGQLISMIGSGLTAFALAVWTVEATRSATPFAITVLLASLPELLLAPLAGVLADRWDRRRILLLTDAGSACVTAAALLLVITGQLALWHVYLLALVGAVFDGFKQPTYTAAITTLVPRDQLVRAAGLGQLSLALEALAVPPLAGLLFVSVGMVGILTLDLLTFVVAIATLFVTAIPQPAPEPTEPGQASSLRADITLGWRYLAARRGLLLLLCYFALVNLLLNGATVLTTPLALSFGSADTLGLIQMCVGAGLLIGSLVASVLAGKLRSVPLVIGSLIVTGLGLAIVGLHPSLAVVGGGFLLLMLAVPVAAASSQAIFQRKVPPALQGRVFAARNMVSQSMMPLGFLGSGLLADRLFEPLLRPGGALAVTPVGALLGVGPGRGIGLMFVGAGLLLVAVSAAALTLPALRRLEQEVPDYDAGTAVEDALESPAAQHEQWTATRSG